MTNPIISRRLDGSICAEEYKNEKGQWHRIDGPAEIAYYDDGSIQSEIYEINGQFHRVDGPAIINYSKTNRATYRKEYWLYDIQFDSLEELQLYNKTLLLI